MTKPIGRPRNKDIEQRTFEAARTLYAQKGWAGFTLSEVAKSASIGKGSLYLRWSSKEELLIDLIREHTHFIAEIDTGNVRNDLILFAHSWMRYLDTEEGVLTYRLTIDARFYPELKKALEQNHPGYVKSTRSIIKRGVDRDELPKETSVALVADLVAGAVSNYVRNTPGPLRHSEPEKLNQYIERIVDTVLSGVINQEP